MSAFDLKRIAAAFIALVLALSPVVAVARGQSGEHSRSHATSTKHGRSQRAHSTHSDSHHRIKRDPAQRRAFQHSHPCPSTGRTSGACRGYVVDHIKPLKRGGPDRPSNMQWQTVSEAKAKDKWE